MLTGSYLVGCATIAAV